jgi:hypothetical protein
LTYVLEFLHSGDWMHGTRYYCTAELFLFFLARFYRSLLTHPHTLETSALASQIQKELRKAVRELVGREGDALQRAMRILVWNEIQDGDLAMEKWAEEEIDALVRMQDGDGSWGDCWIYRFAGNGVRLGNRGLTSVVVGRALRCSGGLGGCL